MTSIDWMRSVLTEMEDEAKTCRHGSTILVRAGENSGLDWDGEAVVFGTPSNFEQSGQDSCVEARWCVDCGALGIVRVAS